MTGHGRLLDRLRGRVKTGQTQIGQNWPSAEKSPFPLGVCWIEEERARHFAFYSTLAKTAVLLLYQEYDHDWTCISLWLSVTSQPRYRSPRDSRPSAAGGR